MFKTFCFICQCLENIKKTATLYWCLVKLFVFQVAKDLQTVAVHSQSVESHLCELCTESSSPNKSKFSRFHTALNESVPKYNKRARAFSLCSQNQSKLQKLGSRSVQLKTSLKIVLKKYHVV